MNWALVVEHDVSLRHTLEDVLHEDGFMCVGVSDMELAREALRLSPHALVVLVGHGDPRDHEAPLPTEASALPRHAYLILSTRPSYAPRAYNPHTQRFVPIVEAPYDIDTLLAYVEEAERRLDTDRANPDQSSAEELSAETRADAKTPACASVRAW